MTVECPSCQSVFRVRVDRLPPKGARTRCGRCGGMIQVAAGELAATLPTEPPVPTMERGSDGLFELPAPRVPSAGAVDLFALDQPGPRPVPPVPASVSPAVFAPESAAAGGERRPGVFGWLFRFLG